MKIKATIKVLDAARSGVSKSTGNPWQSKECVLEVAEEDGSTSTLSCQTFDTNVIKELETALVGDTVDADIQFYARAKRLKREDGSEYFQRNTDIRIKSLEITQPMAL